MRKFLVVLSVLVFLLIAGPVQADWVDDINITNDTNFIGADFSGEYGVVTIKTKSGSCVQYKIVDEEIVATRKCENANWTGFIKNK